MPRFCCLFCKESVSCLDCLHVRDLYLSWSPTLIQLFRPFVTGSDESVRDHAAGDSASSLPFYCEPISFTLKMQAVRSSETSAYLMTARNVRRPLFDQHPPCDPNNLEYPFCSLSYDRSVASSFCSLSYDRSVASSFCSLSYDRSVASSFCSLSYNRSVASSFCSLS
jgi:hypothetical protein